MGSEIERYLDYLRFVVDHFNDRVQYYEIWNEPSSPHFTLFRGIVEVKEPHPSGETGPALSYCVHEYRP